MADRIRQYPKAARNALSGALLALGVLALGNWVLWPHLGYLHAVQRLRPVVDRMTEERERICATLDAKVGEWRTLQRDRAALDEGVFTADRAKAFVRGLLPLVEETGCVVVRADFSPEAKVERLGEPNQPVVMQVSQMNLDVLGQSDQVSVLLRRLGDNRPRAWIDSCQCDFSGGDSGPIGCSLVLTLYTVVDRKGAPEPPERVARGVQTVP